VLESATAVRHGTRCSAQVFLRRGVDQAIGVAEGIMSTSGSLRLVAEAALGALRQLDDKAWQTDLETATMVRIGDRDVATATMLFLVPPSEEFLAGSALVRGSDDYEAMARAVLDATNRRLSRS
jgi:hypothetical protein